MLGVRNHCELESNCRVCPVWFMMLRSVAPAAAAEVANPDRRL